MSSKPGLKRFLRTTPGGLLRVDKQKIATEANLDGKYLLRCSDPHLSAEDIALGYKQLLEVERGWRDMKQILDLRPGLPPARGPHPRPRPAVLARPAADPRRRDHHRRPGPGNRIRTELQRLHAVTFTGPAGTFRQTTEPTKPQRDILTALGPGPAEEDHRDQPEALTSTISSA